MKYLNSLKPAILILLLGLTSIVNAQSSNLTVAARTGERDPNGNLLTFVGTSSTNDRGDIAYIGTSTQANVYIQERNGNGKPRALITKEVPPPAMVGGRYGTITFPKINNLGDFAFSSMIASGNTTGGLFVSIGGQVKKVALDAEPTPFGGVFEPNLSRSPFFAINDRGDVAFLATITQSPTDKRLGLFLFNNSDNSIVKVMLTGDTPPEGGTFTATQNTLAGLNNKGEVVFSASNSGKQHVYLFSNGTITRVVADGDAAPGGGTFTMPLSKGKYLTDSGKIAFLTRINNINTLFLATPQGSGVYTYTRLVGVGDASPDGGTFRDLILGLTPAQGGINERGTLLFRASSTKTDDGLFIIIDGTIRKIVGKQETSPLGGRFPVDAAFNTSILSQMLSADDRVVFESEVENGASDRAVFLWTPEVSNTPTILGVTYQNNLLTVRASRVGADVQLEINGVAIKKAPKVTGTDAVTVKGSRKKLKINKQIGTNEAILIVDGFRSAPFSF